MQTQNRFLGVLISALIHTATLASLAGAAESTPQLVFKAGNVLYQTPEGEHLVKVRPAEERDRDVIFQLNREAFPHDNASDDDARKWVDSHFQGSSQDFARYYVITYEKAGDQEASPVGFALWSIDGGYNHHATVRQDQIAIAHPYRSHGFGEALARLSLLKFQEDLLTPRGYQIEHIYISSGSNNQAALEMYEDALGLKNLGDVGPLFGENKYGKDEFILVNNDVQGFLKAHPLEDLFTK